MIGPQFLIVADGEVDATASRHRRDARATSLVRIHASEMLTIFVEEGGQFLDLGETRGMIIGPLFSRTGSGEPVTSVTSGLATAIWGSRGRHLIDHFWGSYVAILLDPDQRRFEIIRAPCSLLPCYYSNRGGTLVLASDADLLIDAANMGVEIDWAFVTQHLQRPALRTGRTGIAGIVELQWGERLSKTCGRPVAIELVWSPWGFVGSGEPIAEGPLAAAELREAIRHCSRAWASQARHIMLGVSGGLDSSILAACLADGGVPFKLVTLITDDAMGDERIFAQALANALGVELIEAFEDPDRIDLRASRAAHLPRPVARSFAQSGDASFMRLAGKYGTDCFWSGGGGDSVFCLLRSTTPVADRLLVEGPGMAALGTARDLSRLTGAGLPRIILRSTERAWLRPPEYPWPSDMSLLRTGRPAMPASLPDLPWLSVPSLGLPGRAAHIAAIWGIQNFLEGHAIERDYATIYPLLSQPVVECCLRIPTWLWCEGGVDRAVARHAFAADLPDLITHRRSKGSPSGLVIQLYEQRRDEIREILVDGHLAHADLLDIPALEFELSRAGPIVGTAYSRILTLVDVEAWLASWRSRDVASRASPAGGAMRLS